MREIILHGRDRLARRDAPNALHLWHRYDAQQLFEDQDRLEIQRHIATRLVLQNNFEAAKNLLTQSPQLTSEDLTERLIRNALRQQDWQSASQWLAQLPEASRESDRWRYWRARVMEELDLEPEDGPSAMDLYAAVAATRSFYGFLSADKLGYEYRLLDRPVDVTDTLLEQVERLPGITRARELLLVGDLTNAGREWFHTTRALDSKSIIAAGKLAERWGWYRNGIQATIRTRSWDDLQLRFPLAYREQMDSAAEATSINPHLLFAIARQESAFMADARSPAGALGLMQLMPTTAQYTARRAGIPYRKHDLLSPDTNIALGSRYLHQLLNEFNGNRILAAAAYNAGPTRVRQWLGATERDRKSTRLNSSHVAISYAVFCLQKKKNTKYDISSSSSDCFCLLTSLPQCVATLYLHSFPTRRSSDLSAKPRHQHRTGQPLFAPAVERVQWQSNPGRGRL